MSRIFLGYPPAKIKEFIVEHYTPLHFIAEEANAKMSFSIANGTYQTSRDGKKWTDYESGTKITLANVGDKVYFKAKTTNDSCSNSFFIIDSGKIAAKGNIQSLLDETCQRMDVPTYCYSYMFYGCLALTQAPALPATTLASYCYSYMFKDCWNLTTATALPAITLADACYANMFQNCSALTTAPALPATTLADYCYDNMFSGCSALTTATELTATTLTDRCYFHMFSGCSTLTTAPALPAKTLANDCYSYMFSGCSALETASFPNLDKETVSSDVVEDQSAFYYAADDIQATCQDGILVINSTSV